MKKPLALAFVALLLIAPTASFAQTPPAPGAAPAPTSTPPVAPAKGSGQSFQDRKAEIIQHISAHITELQQRQACIQAASTKDALKACMPAKRDRYAQ
jgi:hypothetical protein